MNTSTPTMLINGQVSDQIPGSDRGLAYGHGLFETIAVVKGVPLLWEEHLARLQRGCERLYIEWQEGIEQLFSEEAAKLCANSDAILKIILTAGSGGLGYRLPETQHPLRILISYPLPQYPTEYGEQGVSVCTCKHPLAPQASLAGIKHLNRLDQVLASAEWRGSAFQEGIMLDQEGRVIEGTRTNLFAVDNEGRLVTPELERCGVAGVMRQYLLQQADFLNIDTLQADYSREQFQAMPELFICNSVIGIWPIRQWDEKHYEVGEQTRKLQRLVKALFAR